VGVCSLRKRHGQVGWDPIVGHARWKVPETWEEILHLPLMLLFSPNISSLILNPLTFLLLFPFFFLHFFSNVYYLRFIFILYHDNGFFIYYFNFIFENKAIKKDNTSLYYPSREERGPTIYQIQAKPSFFYIIIKTKILWHLLF